VLTILEYHISVALKSVYCVLAILHLTLLISSVMIDDIFEVQLVERIEFWMMRSWFGGWRVEGEARCLLPWG
jgi:hypothetical protein